MKLFCVLPFLLLLAVNDATKSIKSGSEYSIKDGDDSAQDDGFKFYKYIVKAKSVPNTHKRILPDSSESDEQTYKVRDRSEGRYVIKDGSDSMEKYKYVNKHDDRIAEKPRGYGQVIKYDSTPLEKHKYVNKHHGRIAVRPRYVINEGDYSRGFDVSSKEVKSQENVKCLVPCKNKPKYCPSTVCNYGQKLVTDPCGCQCPYCACDKLCKRDYRLCSRLVCRGVLTEDICGCQCPLCQMKPLKY